MKTIIYHNDVDGFAAAWVVSKFIAGAKYVAVDHGQAPVWEDIDGHQVLIFDFSYPKDVMEEIRRRADSLVCLDHHESSSFLNDIDGCRYDPTMAGCMLAVNHIDPFRSAPSRYLRLLSYVNDGDLGKFELPDSKYIYAAVNACGRTFDVWDDLAKTLENCVSPLLVGYGQSLLQDKRRTVDFILRNAVRISLDGHVVWAVNTSIHQSECASALAYREIGSRGMDSWQGMLPSFGVAWWMLSDRRLCVSLRARNSFDVGAIAKSHGGGGHPGAAAFTFPPDNEPELLRALLGM